MKKLSALSCQLSAIQNLKPGTVNIPPAVKELANLLRNNPGVKIINTPGRYAVLRNGKYVGGRINQLVFSVEVRNYVFNHPDTEITASNLILTTESDQMTAISYQL